MHKSTVANERMVFAGYCEDLADGYLRRKGYRIIARNYYTRRGEIDIIARDGRDLVFIEVKGKRSRNFGSPQEMISRRKMRHLIRTALVYLEGSSCKARAVRFDVVSILAVPGEKPLLDHLESAFNLNDL